MCICGRSLLCLSALAMSVSISQAKEPKHNKNTEVTVEVKFVSLDESVVEQLKQQGLLEQESKGKDVLALDNAQTKRFMEIVQSDIHINVMQAPRLTTFNGQTAEINLIDEQHFVTGLEIVYREGHIEYRPKSETVHLGWRIDLRSLVSKDRRFVHVHLDANANNLDSSESPRFPITTPAPDGRAGTVKHYIEKPQITKIRVNRTVVIPDGNTAVLTTGFKQKRVGRVDYGVPVLCDLPFLGRFFRTTGYSCQTLHLLVLVTPHIRVPQEKEETRSGKASADKQAIRPCRCEDNRTDFRTRILGQYRDNDPQCSEGPDEASVLRALPRVNTLPGIYEESRDNIQIVTERIVDKVDPPRFFPLVGPAQLHHCHWKCTVYYNETITCGYPCFFRRAQVRKQDVFIDTDHLHRVAMEAPGAK